MDNITTRIEGEKLIIEVDLKKALYKTEKGNTMIATSHGFAPIAHGSKVYRLSMNLIEK